MVQLLVKEFGANVNHIARDGRTALMAAASRKHNEIAKILIQHGANPQFSHQCFGTFLKRTGLQLSRAD
jgi:ankyrin repeat protein